MKVKISTLWLIAGALWIYDIAKYFIAPDFGGDGINNAMFFSWIVFVIWIGRRFLKAPE
jgi:hypothetical protein